MKAKNTEEEPLQNLYKDVIIGAGSMIVVLLLIIYLWMTGLIEINIFDPQKSLVLNVLRDVSMYCIIPSTLYCFVVGELSGNLSQVDKLWSVMPAVYCWYITFHVADFELAKLHPKSVLMTVLVTLWGCKLTLGFAFKGGYSWRFWEGEEDYRWVYVRDQLPVLKRFPILMTLFNLGFVSVYQMLLIFAFSGGVMIGSLMLLYTKHTGDLQFSDLFIASILCLILIIETTADIQQQMFQREKYRRKGKKIDLFCPEEHYEVGFRTSGLFGYSRHPNFTCEQLFWLVFYTFTVDFDHMTLFQPIGGVVNISILGSFLLVVLFTLSTSLTEAISCRKYPLYKEYKRNVGRIVDLKNILRKLFLCKVPNRDWIRRV